MKAHRPRPVGFFRPYGRELERVSGGTVGGAPCIRARHPARPLPTGLDRVGRLPVKGCRPPRRRRQGRQAGMSASLVGAWAFLMVAPPPVAATFVQIAPVGVDGAHRFVRTPERFRAVVLVHGLRPHPFRDSPVLQTDLSLWEEPGSPLVRRLGQESDVFAFSYGQNVPVGDVAGAPELAAGVRRLRALGYEQVVLIGYSAGAIVVREFVEDEP